MPVGRSVRLRVRLGEVTEIAGGAQAKFVDTMEAQGGERPVCVAEFLIRVYGSRG
jgi:hypothetical protein